MQMQTGAPTIRAPVGQAKEGKSNVYLQTTELGINFLSFKPRTRTLPSEHVSPYH